MNTPAQQLSIVILQNNGNNNKIDHLASRTNFPVTTDLTASKSDFCLHYNNNQLTLRDQTSTTAVDVAIDFCTGKNRHRQQYGGGLGQPLARAVNAKKLNQNQIVCDATAGFGRDALVVAGLGCQVVLLEQNIVVYELLRDALQRAEQDTVMSPVASRMQVHLVNSFTLPNSWPIAGRPHTIYLDPMYPQTSKSAAAKKEMQILKHMLPGTTAESDGQLLAAALATASDRVVVKRPKRAPVIAGPQPVGNISSINTRYDLYRP